MNEEEYIIERLSLRTREKYINAIVSGEQKVETRICSPFYANRLIHYVDKQKFKWDSVKQVQVLHLYAGNNEGCKFVDVKVNETRLIDYIKDMDGFKKGDMIFEFELGEVIAHN